MCNPVFAATMLMTTASAGMSIYNQKQVQEAEKKNFDFASQQASKEAAASYSALARQQAQEGAAATQAIEASAAQARVAAASARGAGAAAGVGGGSVSGLLNEYQAVQSENARRVIQQRSWSLNQARSNVGAVEAQQYSRVLQAAPKSPGPDYMGALLSIGQAGVQGYYQSTVYDPSKGKRVFV